MKKNRLFIGLILLTFSFASQGKQMLTKELLTSFQQVSQQWESLEVDYPELDASLDDIDGLQAEKLITMLKNSNAYPKIKSILADSKFVNLEEYYDVSMRVMGGMMAYQLQNMPQGININLMTGMLKNNIAQMKASNAPKAMVDEIEMQLADMEKSIKEVKRAMKNTSVEDKKFISENAQWIMSILGEQ
ncbi:MAG: hypothetical protein JJV99_01135 [Colwellia sp.]|nr:hypothetical protein [Colwellia sp.]